MIERVITLHLDDDLNFALGQFTALNVDELPVVSADDKNRVIGVLRRKELRRRRHHDRAIQRAGGGADGLPFAFPHHPPVRRRGTSPTCTRNGKAGGTRRQRRNDQTGAG